jgi:hypothetical protein
VSVPGSTSQPSQKGTNVEISGVTLDQFHTIVNMISSTRYLGNITLHRDAKDLHGVRKPRIRARLAVSDSRAPGARRSWTGRRMPVACWHAYRDVLAELFRLFPNAVVRTGMAKYNGQAGFLAAYPATADINIGSQMQPVRMPDCCDCSTDNRRARPMEEHVPMMFDALRERTNDLRDSRPLVASDSPRTAEVLAEADRVLTIAQAQTPSEWLLATFDAATAEV